MRAALIALLALVASPALAATPGGATESLRARDAEIRAALPPQGQELTPSARKRIEAIITRAIDLRSMVESAMDKHWKPATEAQRKRLIAAFENRFRKASGSELDSYRSTDLEYQKEIAQDDGLVQVPTRVVVKGEPTDITYTLRHNRDGGWRIVDLTVDGVSTVENYRSSFSRTIAKEGVDGLIHRLEKGSASK